MFRRTKFVEGVGNTTQTDPKKIRILTAQKQEKMPGVIRPKPTDSSGQPFKPKPIGKKAGGRIGFNKGSGRTGVGAMDVKSKIAMAKKKKKKNKFPDISGDGEITKKDILMARGVIPKPKNKTKAKV